MWSTILTSDPRRLALGVILAVLATIGVWLIVRAKVSLSTMIFAVCCLIWLTAMALQLRHLQTLA